MLGLMEGVISMAITLVKNKSGKSFRAVLYQSHRKVAQKTFKRKIDAQKWLDEQERRFSLGYVHKVKLKEAFDHWLEYSVTVRNSPATIKNYKWKIEKAFLPFFGNPDLDALTTNDIERFIAQLKAKELKNATINRYLQVLKAMINYYRKKEYILKNVVSIVGLLPEEPHEADFLSFEEAKSFLVHVSQKYQGEKRWVYAFYLFALNTGMRIGEILALKWDSVDLLGRRIIVRRSYCNRTHQIRETTKGRKIRHLGINSALLPELQEIEKNSRSKGEFVFQKNGKVIQIANFKRDFYKKDLKECGLRPIKFHELRHTFASHFVMKNGNIYDLQKLLGHTHVRTTERYSHLAPEHIIKQTELVAIDGGKNIIPIHTCRQKQA